MTWMLLMQRADAAMLMIMTISAIIIAQEDTTLGRLPRFAVLVVGIASFAQVLWLLGIWEPGAAGYPSARLALDAALAFSAAVRVGVVLQDADRRRGVQDHSSPRLQEPCE
jgi:hypothetical protein